MSQKTGLIAIFTKDHSNTLLQSVITKIKTLAFSETIIVDNASGLDFAPARKLPPASMSPSTTITIISPFVNRPNQPVYQSCALNMALTKLTKNLDRILIVDPTEMLEHEVEPYLGLLQGNISLVLSVHPGTNTLSQNSLLFRAEVLHKCLGYFDEAEDKTQMEWLTRYFYLFEGQSYENVLPSESTYQTIAFHHLREDVNTLVDQQQVRQDYFRLQYYQEQYRKYHSLHPTKYFSPHTRTNLYQWNQTTTELYRRSIVAGGEISNTCALSVKTGKYTGRVPHAKRLVLDEITADINWDGLNSPITPKLFAFYLDLAQQAIRQDNNYFIVDAYAGWHYSTRVSVRIYTYKAEHALFSKNMLIPCRKPLQNPNLTIYDLGNTTLQDWPSPPEQIEDKTLTDALVALDLANAKIVIAGTQYAGEIKKAVFSYMMYRMPLLDYLPLHSSANVNLAGQDPTLFFGLSGTGKTTLSAEENRVLIGDDEHVWHPGGIFNIEGGCYAKCINLEEEKEPDIFRAIRMGAVLENVAHDHQGTPDYHNVRVTENSRVSYPLSHLNSLIPARTNNHPKTIIFLTCDVTGVIPPLSLLTEKQAITCFLLGYTSKVPGTEVAVKEPEITFSACFGEPFLVWKPERYGELLLHYLKRYPAKVWLLNTGWMGGPATEKRGENGLPRRVPIIDSRRMVKYAQEMADQVVETTMYSDFGWEIPTQIPGLSRDGLLRPEEVWSDRMSCQIATQKLYSRFKDAFLGNYGKVTFSKYWFGKGT